MAKTRDIVLSSTAINLYKRCNWSYFLKYILGWRPEEDKTHFRVGGHWAKCQELYNLEVNSLCPECGKNRNINPDCYLCQGTGNVQQDPMQTVLRYLNFSYAEKPDFISHENWDTERLTLLHAFVGYKWRYPKEEYEVIATEIPFSLPIIDPATGKKISACRLDGMIDQLWRHKNTGRIVIGEQKSTGSSLENGEFWEHLMLTGQVQTYSYAAWMLWVGGALKKYGLKPEEAVIVQPVYDVWKKPNISPKKLTQADSKKFVETGEYYGEKFDVLCGTNFEKDGPLINDIRSTIELGAKEGVFAIRETPEMYAARLLQDITERPDFYFARKEVPIEEADLKEFADDCVKLVKTIRYIEKNGLWLRDAKGCKNPGKCDYYKACHEHRNHPLVSDQPPEGYSCYFSEDD